QQQHRIEQTQAADQCGLRAGRLRFVRGPCGSRRGRGGFHYPIPSSSEDSRAVPQRRQITEEQSPQVKGSVTSSAQLGQYSWAAAGEGPKMENHHLDITEKTLCLMNLRPGERVLDLGCGSGWATRLLARLVGDGPEGFGQVVGLDVSDEMVRQAREASKDFENIMYVWGSAQQIPWEENFFDKVLSVESFYYYPDQDRALMELFRVMAPRGSLFI